VKHRRAAVAALALAAEACRAEPAPSEAREAATGEPAPASSARRPTRRFALSRHDDRCEIAWEDEGARSPALETPCPQDLEPGERIRLTGRTCVREGERRPSAPVVCPDPLTNFEKWVRGERKEP
jgi:hypothetical protein